jgi:hypothetical protein
MAVPPARTVKATQVGLWLMLSIAQHAPREGCRMRKVRRDRTRSGDQAALHPVGEGLAVNGAAQRIAAGRPQRFGTKGKLASRLFGLGFLLHAHVVARA